MGMRQRPAVGRAMKGGERPCRAAGRPRAAAVAPHATRSGARAGRLAVLALCAALALPAALAVPYYDGDAAADPAAWLYGQGGGAWLAAPAHAQVTDDDLNTDFNNEAVFIAPNQLNITYTKNASADTNLSASYLVAMDLYDFDGNGDSDLRNVTGIAGNGTMVHTLTFDGPPVEKNAVADILVGRITNVTNTLWGSLYADWADVLTTPSIYSVGDAQRPAVVSARLTSNTTLAVAYDEPVSYKNHADYAVTLGSGSVDVTSVLDADGLVLVPSEASTQHVLGLSRSVTLDEIRTLDIAVENITDNSQYFAGGEYVIGNALVNDTVTVADGQEPRPIRAVIVGPLQINVTFSEPVNSSPANYEGLVISSDYLPSVAINRTVVEVVGNGTATHTLTLSMSEYPIPLPPTGPRALGSIGIVGVTDTSGNACQIVYIPVTDARTPEGTPSMTAARFTGPNEVTVTYNASVTVKDGDYKVLAYAHSVKDALEYDTIVNYTFATYKLAGSNASDPSFGLNGTFADVTIASVDGNGTDRHTIRLSGSGVLKTATGVLNMTGTASDGQLLNRTNAPVYDEQLPRVVSARITGNNTVLVEYDQPTFGPRYGYRSVSSGDDSRSIEAVHTGTTGVIDALAYGTFGARNSSAFNSTAGGADGPGWFEGGDDEPIPFTTYDYTTISVLDPYRYGSLGSVIGYGPTGWIVVSDPPPVVNRIGIRINYAIANPDIDISEVNENTTVGYTGDLVYTTGETVKIEVINATTGGDSYWLVRTAEAGATGSLLGREYMAIHSIENANTCIRTAEAGNVIPAGFSAAAHPGCSGIGTHHMITFSGAPVADSWRGSLTAVSVVRDDNGNNTRIGVAGANGDPLGIIGASYGIGHQYVSENRSATIALSVQGMAGFPSIKLPPREAVLHMLLNEPVDPSSIDASKVTVSTPSGAIRLDNRNVTVIGESRVLIGIPVSNTTYTHDGSLEFKFNRTNSTGAQIKVVEAVPRNGNFTTIDYLANAITVPVTIEKGLVANTRGEQMAVDGRYYAVVDGGPVPAEAVAARMSGTNAFEVSYTGPVGVAYENLVLTPGGMRGIDGVDGNGTTAHTVRFDGLPVRPSAGGSVSIVENLGAIFADPHDTGYAVDPGMLEIMPLSPADVAPAAVSVLSAGIVSGNTMQVTYTAPLNATQGDYTGLVLAPGGERNVTAVNGNGTARHTVGFDGAAASPSATAAINIAILAAPDGYAAFGGAASLPVSDMRRSGTAGLMSLEYGQGMVRATYTDPVDAAVADYTITHVNGTSIRVTGMSGSGDAVHLVGHEAVLNGTWIRVSISPLDDEGSGNTYAGTTQPVAVQAISPARIIAELDRLTSNGTHLAAVYTHPVDTHDASQRVDGAIPPGAYYYTIAHVNGTAVPITGVSGNAATTHVIGHASVPDGTTIQVSIRAHESDAAGTFFMGVEDRQVTVDTDAPIVVDPPPSTPSEPIVVSVVDAQFTSPSRAAISYSGPLDGPRDAYGRVTGEGGLDAATTSVTGWGTKTHTIEFDGSVNATQTGRIALNDDLRGTMDGKVYTFTNDSIPIASGGMEVTLGSGTIPIERDGFTPGPNGTIGGITARIGINITALGDTMFVSETANNTARFPDDRNITMTTTFAQVAIPPNTTAMSVPASGVLELYVAPNDRLPAPVDVIEALNLGNNTVRIGRVVEIGDSETHITFDMPIRLLLEGQAGGRAFYINNTNDVVMPINTVCRADDTAEVHDQLGGMGDCQLDSGRDKVIHTYHLTRFGTATPVDTKTHTMVVTVVQPTTGGNGGTGPPTVVVPPPVQPGQTGQPGTTFFAGGSGGGGGGGGGGSGGLIPSGSAGPVLYSAAWDCDDDTVRVAINSAVRSPEVVVVSSAGSVPASVADMQGMAGRTVYEAPLPTDETFSVRTTAVEGRAVASVTESVRTGGACTGEAVFIQYAPGDGARPGGMAARDGPSDDGQEAQEPARQDPQQPRQDRPGAQPGSQDPADGAAGADGEPMLVRPTFEIEEGRDASYYVKRYAEQPAYREWFDSSYPQYADICEAVGVEAGCVEAHLQAKADADGTGMDGAPDTGATPQPTAAPAPDDDDSGCLIATAAYGTELAPQVQALREYRDGTLLATGSGSAFMSSFSAAYYAFSPHVADLEREHPALRQAVAAMIAPMLYSLQVATEADPASEESVLAYGILAIGLVAGMYVVAPAAGAWYAVRVWRGRSRITASS